MAMELFGSPIGPLDAVACLASWLSSGSKGIYSAQVHAFAKGTHHDSVTASTATGEFL